LISKISLWIYVSLVFSEDNSKVAAELEKAPETDRPLDGPCEASKSGHGGVGGQRQGRPTTAIKRRNAIRAIAAASGGTHREVRDLRYANRRTHGARAAGNGCKKRSILGIESGTRRQGAASPTTRNAREIPRPSSRETAMPTRWLAIAAETAAIHRLCDALLTKTSR